LGIGDWGLGPIPNPQSPIPNPQSPIPIHSLIFISLNYILNNNMIKNLFIYKMIEKNRKIFENILKMNINSKNRY
jgi:hypothetical protein